MYISQIVEKTKTNVIYEHSMQLYSLNKSKYLRFPKFALPTTA